jgi:hypothetical protein
MADSIWFKAKFTHKPVLGSKFPLFDIVIAGGSYKPNRLFKDTPMENRRAMNKNVAAM